MLHQYVRSEFPTGIGPPEIEAAALAGTRHGGKVEDQNESPRKYSRPCPPSTWQKLGDVTAAMLRKWFGGVK